MGLQWIVHSPLPEELTRPLREDAGMHPLVADILFRRGIQSPEEARKYLQPSLDDLHDPFLLKGMDAAVEALVGALESERHIVISGDYDVDGITSSALLSQFLRQAGCDHLATFIPNRFDHGYGLTSRTVDALLELKPDLVITVDNGITAIEEVSRLQAEGVQTIITDHHLPREEGIPPGIVVNPRQPECGYPFKGISGCGVAFKLVMALRKVLRERGWWNDERPEPNLKSMLDLVAIGTVADIVPLQDENRVLVRHGLEVMNRPGVRPGLAALFEVAGIDRVSERAIGFQIAPRINAVGRMTEGSLGVELLLADTLESARLLAVKMDEENDRRRAKGKEMMKEAEALIAAEELASGRGIVVASPEFHQGIIGIVAARLVDQYHRPAVVFAENGSSYKGSARSIPGVNVAQALAACDDLLSAHGGHAGAAGCTLPKDSLQVFRERFAQACAEQSPQEEPPPETVDGHLRPGQCDPRLVEQVLALGPFGHQNEEPTFLMEGADLPPPRPLGKGHLKWQLEGNTDMVAWRLAGTFEPGPATRYRVRVEFNEFRGRRKVQLVVKEVAAE